jgi:hypothetical protein
MARLTLLAMLCGTRMKRVWFQTDFDDGCVYSWTDGDAF